MLDPERTMPSIQGNPLKKDLDFILSRTKNQWEELRGCHIFITGGTGFFGNWLLESFVWANDHLDLKATAFVLTRDLESYKGKAPHLANHPSINFVEGDILSFDFPHGEFQYLIHAATETAHDLYDKDPLLAFEVIVSGTRHILEFARKAKVTKLLFTSSGAVYGYQPPHMMHIQEDYQGAPSLSDPNIVYGEGKRVAELLCSLYARKYGFEAKIARCFAFVGPYMPLDQHVAIGNFIRDALQGGPIQVQGDGTPFRSYLYAADLAIWLWTILFRGKSCRPYNVGSDAAIQIKDVAISVARELPGGSEVVVKGVTDVSSPAQRYVPDVNRARQELGLSVEIPLSVGVRRTMRWNSGMSLDPFIKE